MRWPALKVMYEDARDDQCNGCGHLINATELINPRCKLCNQTPVVKTSDHFFLNLPKIEPKIKEYVSSAEANWSGVARSATKPWLQDGLKPRCITRDIKWGIPVPLKSYEDKVFYEWSTTKTTSNSGVLSQRWTSRCTSS
ncbi:hypothetical protein KQX54_010781 [Cotesia glomerata]|uniref:Methionyl/Leucyl tRNA synthetase domain-containing protein n=1 Tax=Cotesia glomerata TaxID=32391 RepID=A0AAV7IHE5_COTGL|nr:hypothetical protein KQX54_010781 [Cotesia glomerata]